ncbi:MAG: hypothetical protein ACFBSC_02265 [Microcoleaceae cyanobacterium]
MKGWPLHATRESVSYAVALLNKPEQAMYGRATRIIDQVIRLQINQASHQHRGNWPKYWEEHHFKTYRIDPNRANFISTDLIEILISHRDKLSNRLIRKIDTAILNAAEYIRNREIPLPYTNILVSSIYVTTITGQMYKNSDLLCHGLRLLRDFHAHTFDKNSFTEYNSPVYQVLSLKHLARLKRDVEDWEAQALVKDLYKLAWKNIAEHFHPPTQQWAGPHSRSYSSLTQPQVIHLVQESTTEAVKLHISSNDIGLNVRKVPCTCPPDLEHYFIALKKSRTVTQVLQTGQRLTTYLNPKFSLGSISFSDLWHQRNAMIAYWGTPEFPCYARMRFLNEGRDWSAAQFKSIQNEGRVLAGINLATDVDFWNPYVKNKTQNQSFSLKNLRLRFEFNSYEETHIEVEQIPKDLSQPVVLKHGEFYFNIGIAFAKFGGIDYKWEFHSSNSIDYLDLVIYDGFNSPISLSNLKEAVFGMTFEICSSPSSPFLGDFSLVEQDSHIDMKWADMHLNLWKRPAPQLVLMESLKLASPANHVVNPSTICNGLGSQSSNNSQLVASGVASDSSLPPSNMNIKSVC